MRSWPIRIKLLATPVAAAAVIGLVPWLVILVPSHRIAIALSAFGVLVILAMAARFIADDLNRRIGEMRDSLAPLQDPNARPDTCGDELDALSDALHRTIVRGQERETQLHRSSDFLRFAQCAGGFGIFDLDLATGQIAGTPLFFQLIGFESHGLPFTRHDWLATIHPENFEAVITALNDAIQGDGNFQAEYRTLMLNGAVRWLAARGEVSRDADGVAARIIGTVTDVTERKHLEESLRHKTESLTIAQAAAGVATMDLNFHRRSWICSDNFHAMLGISDATPLNDLNGRLSRVHPDDVERIRRAPFETTVDQPSYRCEYRLRLPDDSERWIAEKANVTHGPGGEILRIAGALIDITDLKRTEAALTSTEKRLARTMRGTRDGVWEIDLKANEFWFGPRFEELLGFGNGELEPLQGPIREPDASRRCTAARHGARGPPPPRQPSATSKFGCCTRPDITNGCGCAARPSATRTGSAVWVGGLHAARHRPQSSPSRRRSMPSSPPRRPTARRATSSRT